MPILLQKNVDKSEIEYRTKHANFGVGGAVPPHTVLITTQNKCDSGMCQEEQDPVATELLFVAK